MALMVLVEESFVMVVLVNESLHLLRCMAHSFLAQSLVMILFIRAILSLNVKFVARVTIQLPTAILGMMLLLLKDLHR